MKTPRALLVALSVLLAFSSLAFSTESSVDEALVASLRARAQQGDSSAQNLLAHLHEHGRGVPQNYTEAAKWYRRAAEQGVARAQSSLGRLYEGGQGVPQDYAEAAKWYGKAADQHDVFAQVSLGRLY